MLLLIDNTRRTTGYTVCGLRSMRSQHVAITYVPITYTYEVIRVRLSTPCAVRCALSCAPCRLQYLLLCPSSCALWVWHKSRIITLDLASRIGVPAQALHGSPRLQHLFWVLDGVH